LGKSAENPFQDFKYERTQQDSNNRGNSLKLQGALTIIPENITKENILTAIAKIQLDGVPEGRESTKFSLMFQDKTFLPKYVVFQLAHLYANGIELKPTDFSGGLDENSFLKKLGFEISELSDVLQPIF
jgi:hypothetical protein